MKFGNLSFSYAGVFFVTLGSMRCSTSRFSFHCDAFHESMPEMDSEFAATMNVSISGDSVQHQGPQDISQDSSRDDNLLAHSSLSSDHEWFTDEDEEISSSSKKFGGCGVRIGPSRDTDGFRKRVRGVGRGK